MRRKMIVLFIIVIGIFVIFMTNGQNVSVNKEVSNYYILNANDKIQSPNVVTAIYLYFRYYDTLFETLILMFSIMGIITLSIHEGDDEDE